MNDPAAHNLHLFINSVFASLIAILPRKFPPQYVGHPTSRFRFTEAATGSLGQGLSIGVGSALAAKLDMLENEEGWHGKAMDREQLEETRAKLGDFDENLRGKLASPDQFEQRPPASENSRISPQEAHTTAALQYDRQENFATRDAYGNALNRIISLHPNLISLGGEVCNSTRAQRFRDEHQQHFLEMYIAEQNMVGLASGMSRRGKLSFVSTFAAFLTRAFDQIRMAPYSDSNIKFVGSLTCGRLVVKRQLFTRMMSNSR